MAKEIYKVENDILPNALGEFLTKRNLKYNLRGKVSTTFCGTESIRIFGPKIWDLVPTDIKNADSLDSFQAKIKNWKVENCPCRLCKTFIEGLGFL